MYRVLARTWRPQRFDELVGQHHIARALANAVESRRLAHAYIFAGVRGIGKTTVARILAKLGLRDRVQAVVVAYRTGLVTP